MYLSCRDAATGSILVLVLVSGWLSAEGGCCSRGVGASFDDDEVVLDPFLATWRRTPQFTATNVMTIDATIPAIVPAINPIHCPALTFCARYGVEWKIY